MSRWASRLDTLLYNFASEARFNRQAGVASHAKELSTASLSSWATSNTQATWASRIKGQKTAQGASGVIDASLFM